MMALVRSGLGIALVPEAAATLRFTGVIVRPIKLAKPPTVELHIVWKRDGGNPLVPILLDVVRKLAVRA